MSTRRLTLTGIESGSQIQAAHVSQSVDALNGTKDYLLTPSGTFHHTGSFLLTGNAHITGTLNVSSSQAGSITGSFGIRREDSTDPFELINGQVSSPLGAVDGLSMNMSSSEANTGMGIYDLSGLGLGYLMRTETYSGSIYQGLRSVDLSGFGLYRRLDVVHNEADTTYAGMFAFRNNSGELYAVLESEDLTETDYQKQFVKIQSQNSASNNTILMTPSESLWTSEVFTISSSVFSLRDIPQQATSASLAQYQIYVTDDGTIKMSFG